MLLIEDLDALGADVADARERAAWLRSAGARVAWIAVVPRDAALPPAPLREAQHVLPNGRAAAGQVRALASSMRWDLVLVASAGAGGGPLAAALPPGLPTRWWPTGIEPASGQRSRLAALARRVLGAAPSPGLDGTQVRGAATLLGWSAVEGRRVRRPGLPLWDGDLVLAPEGLSGEVGDPVLAAFAALASEWSGVDLVDWAHPRTDVTRRAHVLGVAMRVHQVGPPPRMAEWAWWSQASAALLSGRTRLSTGLVLRALASGCPLVWVAPGAPAAGLARWLRDQGCALVTGATPEAVARTLACVLERGPEVEEMIERGRALAERHAGDALAERLAALLGPASAPASAAAA